MASESYRRAAFPVQVVGNKARIECNQCGAHEDWKLDAFPPPEILKKHFIMRGWDLARRSRCPTCAAKKEKPKMSIVPMPKPEPVIANTDAAKKNKRLVVVALEDYYDESTNRYRDQFDDVSVAKELGLSPAFVASVREEFYGKMAEPDEVTALRGEVSKLMMAAQEINSKLDGMAKRNGWVA